MNSEPTNAVAGPSNLQSFSRPSLPPTPQLFLPESGPPPTYTSHLSSTQDLLTRFNLLSAYDKYVRPFSAPVDGSSDIAAPPPLTPGANGSVDKGKGKEVMGLPDTPGGGDLDEDGEGGKKKRNNYKHLIKGIPGKHSMKKDEYLFTMMQIPPKQRIQIQQFDQRTQADAFTVSLEGLKGWNPAALILESAQAREDRKKRKELKRLQKAQAQGIASPSVAQPQPVAASTPATASTPRPSGHPASSSTPRPGSTIPSLPTPVQRPGSTAPIQRPGSAVPRPGSTKPGPVKPSIQVPVGKVGTPLRSGISLDTPIRSPATMTPQIPPSNTWPGDAEKRGVKRERDEMSPNLPATNGSTMVNGNGVMNALASKAGSAGVRPRPMKKQRMDIPGQGRELSVTQQPTPQGV